MCAARVTELASRARAQPLRVRFCVVLFVIMSGTLMSPCAIALAERLAELAFPGNGVRRNVVARFLELNSFSAIEDLAFADSPATWLEPDRARPGEVEFLKELIRGEHVKVCPSRRVAVARVCIACRSEHVKDEPLVPHPRRK